METLRALARMRILIAEDEKDIASSYKDVLEAQGHEITLTSNGRLCLEEYRTRFDGTSSPFDAVLLDYRMPEMNGFEAAIEILKLAPNQRIIFASAYSRETLEDLIRSEGMMVELLQKPFGRQELISTVEDTLIYTKLQKLRVDVGDIKTWNPTHKQLSDLLDGLLKLKDPNTVFDNLLAGSSTSKPGTAKVVDLTKHEEQSGHDRIGGVVDDSLRFLGPDSISVFYFHLSKMGVQKQAIAQNPQLFVKAIQNMFGDAAQMVLMRILATIEDTYHEDPSVVDFANSLKQVKKLATTKEQPQ